MKIHEDKVKLIAEIGGNHEGDFSYAKELVNLAAEANVDVIKFQIYSGETLVNKDIDIDRKKHFDKFTFTNEQYVELAEKCQSLGIDFNASIWNKEQIDFFDDYLSFYKLGSGDLTAFPIIQHLARKGKPIILSTGLSNGMIAQPLSTTNTLKFTIEGSDVFVNQAQVTTPNVQAGNGAVHVLNGVMLPSETVADIAIDSPDHTTLTAAVVEARLLPALTNPFAHSMFIFVQASTVSDTTA